MKPRYSLSDEPCMSDQTLLVSVEDLINLGMGPQEGNVVDFKIIQTILHILARQMRLLEQKVVLEVGELPHKKTQDSSSSQSTSDDSKKQRGRKQIDAIAEEAEGKGRRHSAERGRSGERGQAEGRDQGGKDQGGKDGGKGPGGKDAGKGQVGKDQGGKDGGKGQVGKDQGEKDGGKGPGGKDQGGKDGAKSPGGKDQGGKDGAKGPGGKDQGGKDGAKGPGGKDQGGKGSAGGKDQEGGKGSGGKGQEVGKGQDGGKSPVGKGGKSKEQAKAEEELAKEGKKGGKGKDEDTKGPGKTGIQVKDGTGPDKEKVLVVEKGPTTRGTAADAKSRSIEVVTQSQFALLEAAVATLREQAGPLPALTLPDNDQLRSDLARGTASLTDTMQAMQVSARVKAAEQAVSRLGGLLTQLAAAGAIPEDAVARAAAVTFGEGGEDVSEAGASKSASFHPSTKDKTGADMGRRQSRASSRPSTASRASARAPLVTQPEMADALVSLREELTKQAQQLIFKATNASEGAVNTAKAVSEKLDVAVKLNGRISNLYSIVSDYADQLSGFDAGLTTQMQSFQEQMVQMRSDLRGGLTQLENANSNAETAAVMELTERYELLVGDLEHTMQSHQALTGFQQQLGADLRSLVACVEMLREQKADRDEVLDGLRDKADNTRLAGLLRQEAFEEARNELERRLEVCHDKFHRQEKVWMTAVKELGDLAQTKAELMELLKMREESTQQLQNLHDKVKKLELVLGEPKAAVLTRKLARGAVCAACLVPALMDPEDAISGKPPALPRALPEPASQPCEKEWKPDVPPDLRTHTCRRWVGGSHTLLTFASRAQATEAPALDIPTKKYIGVGKDGRLYWLESEMQPCVECNPLEPGATTPEEGGGDGKNKDARRRTMTAPAAVDPAALK